MEEIWKDIKEYEGLYKISSLGRIKSLKQNKEKILKQTISSSKYLGVRIPKNGIYSTRTTHQLMAITFLNHIPDGYKIVVDHIDNDRSNNRLDNIQLVTARENLSKDRKGTSKYTGVTWHKRKSKWQSTISTNGKLKHLGYFLYELKASEAYEKALYGLNN